MQKDIGQMIARCFIHPDFAVHYKRSHEQGAEISFHFLRKEHILKCMMRIRMVQIPDHGRIIQINNMGIQGGVKNGQANPGNQKDGNIFSVKKYNQFSWAFNTAAFCWWYTHARSA